MILSGLGAAESLGPFKAVFVHAAKAERNEIE
jgi:hypothetical protein